jgi:hypothetical protein
VACWAHTVSSFQEGSPFSSVDWYNVQQDKRTLKPSFVAAVLSIIIKRLSQGLLSTDLPTVTMQRFDVRPSSIAAADPAQ